MANAVKRTDGRGGLSESAEDTARGLQELRLRQVELETQNQELRREQAELALSQARYFDLYDRAPVGYITVDASGLILEANLAAASLLGAEPGELAAQAISRFILPADQGIYAQHSKQVFETSQAQGCELRMTRRDGSWFWARLEGTAAEASIGRMVLIDITARKQSEESLRESEARNRHLQKAESLGRMAGAIAHHFNNKLQTVMANLELLDGPPLGVDPARCISMARRATEKAAEVSRLMLLYLGQTTSRREPRFLSELCRNSLPLVRDTLPGTAVMETDWPEPGPVISANEGEIQRVLINLVSNAWEAMDETRACLRLGVKRVPAAEIPTAHRYPAGWQPLGSEYACLEVRDNGCGISEGDMDKLFDPFYSTKFISRGLGLSIVLGIVHAHEGVVTVESRPGEYCVFRIYFPVSPEAPNQPERSVPASATDGGGTILLVDDDELLLMSTGALIEMLGFTLLTARNGVEALEVFREYKGTIRCVITDLTMPRMDGWETLMALRQIDPVLPVILASGYDKAHALSGAHPEQPQVFLGKPFGLQVLREALGKALGCGQLQA